MQDQDGASRRAGSHLGHRHDLQSRGCARGGPVGAGAPERSRLRGRDRRRRLGPRDRGPGGALAAAAGRAARPCLAGSIGLSRRRDPQPRHPRLPAAIIASSSTATASRGPTSSRPIAGWRNRAGSSPATACCSRAALTAAVLSDGLRARDAGAPPIGSRQRLRGGVNRLAALLRLPLGRAAQARAGTMARRALLQSRGLALRSRARRRLRRELPAAGAARIPIC